MINAICTKFILLYGQHMTNIVLISYEECNRAERKMNCKQNSPVYLQGFALYFTDVVTMDMDS